MNAPFSPDQLERARFSVAQIWALIDKGVMNEDARFEMLDGEIIPMSPKGPLHEKLSLAVMTWVRSLPARLAVLPETTLYLDEFSFVEPDYVVFDSGLAIEDLTPARTLLAIELGKSSWTYDTKTKAAWYAECGVQEYWAIEASSRMIRVHRAAGGGVYGDVRDYPAGEAVTPLYASEHPLRLQA